MREGAGEGPAAGDAMEDLSPAGAPADEPQVRPIPLCDLDVLLLLLPLGASLDRCVDLQAPAAGVATGVGCIEPQAGPVSGMDQDLVDPRTAFGLEHLGVPAGDVPRVRTDFRGTFGRRHPRREPSDEDSLDHGAAVPLPAAPGLAAELEDVCSRIPGHFLDPLH